MAVEIPVVIDIDAAFKEAAKRVDTAMVPLQKKMDENALAIRVNIDTKNLTVKQVLDDATLSAKELKLALADIDKQISAKAAAGGFDLSSGLKYSEKILLQAAGALEAKVNGVKDSSAIMARIFAANIDKAKVKITELTAKIDDLTRKQNKYNAEAKRNTPGAKLNYANITKRIEEANSDLATTRKRLGDLTVELEKVSNGAKVAGASIGAMKTPAMQMAEQWRRGTEYVQRYNASLGAANSRMLSLVKSGASLLALHSATSFIRNVREVTSEFELQRVALGSIIRDTEMAEKLFKQIKAAAIESPFEIKDLVSYTKQLSAYQIETEKLFDTTMKLADISAGLGVDMGRLILAFGQVRAASVLRGQELRQFTEAGIPLVDKLAEKFRELGREGTTTADVFELISKRAVPFSMISEIFDDMTSAGGTFYKMQEKQAETLKGQWMKLKDALSIMYDEIGNTSVVHGAMEALLKDAMGLLQNWREVGQRVAAVVAAMIAYKVAIVNARIAANALTAAEMAEVSALELNVVGRSKLIASIFGEVAATKVQVAVGNLYVKMKQREMMATNLFTRSLYRMTAALLANPYALAVAGIAALVAVIYRYTKKAKEAVITTEQLQKSVTKFDKAKSQARDIDELCDAYDKLTSKSKLTRDEQEKLGRVTNELAKAYPSAITGAKNHAKAMEIDTASIRERNKEVREAIALTLQEDKVKGEKRVAELKAEYDRISEILQRGSVQKGAYGGVWFEPITEEDRREFGKRILEIEKDLGDLQEAVDSASNSLRGFKDGFIGPPLPQFFGDAWRENMNSYSVMLSDATSATKAFTPDQIKNFKTVEDAVGEAISEYEKLEKSVVFYQNAVESATGEEKKQLQSRLSDAILLRDLYSQIITDYNAWYLVKDKGGKSYQQPAFISQFKDGIKFMQDFKKGYDDLAKYLSSDAALAKESDLMEKRGLSLGIDPSEQKRAANELSQWYQEARERVFEEAKKYGATGSVESFLSREINETEKNGKVLKDFQNLIQSLWDAQTDLDVSDAKKKLEQAISKLKDELKRSEAAKNFYNDILGLTGDQELAANMAVSVYGDPGKELGDRIRQSIADALNAPVGEGPSVTAAQRSAIENAAKNLDFREVLKEVDQYPDHVRDAVKEAADIVEKYNMDIAKSFAELVSKYGSTQQKIDTITAKATNEIKKVKEARDKALKEPGVTTEQSKKINDRADEVIKALEAQRDLDIFKAGDDYIKFFAELNVMTADQATLVRTKLRDAYLKAFHDGAISADELSKNLRAIDTQFRKLTQSSSLLESYLDGGFDKANEKLQEYADNVFVLAQKMKSGKELSADEQNFATKMLSQFGSGSTANIESYQQLIEAFSGEGGGLEAAGEAFGQMGEGMSAMAANGPGALAIVDAIFKAVHATISGIQQIIDQLNEVRSEENKIGDWFKYISDFDRYTFSGWEKLKSGDAIGATVDAISSWISIFTNAQKDKVKKFNDQIKEQGTLLEDLEYEYSRLSVATEKSFGSDYISNYNKQLEVLQAQAEAYRNQAELERKKGKSADEDTAKGYEKSAQQVEDQIADMQTQLSEFMSGTDLTSAAKDFAEAWIEAYKEFGSTTNAMSEKFNEMIENMVVNSLAAQLIQGILKPIFDQIDAAARDGALSAEEIASISALVPDAMAQIDAGMTGLMSQLTAAGVNLRQQAGSFTGISRDLATASEESITGLAAGINTQNFYMQHIDMNVALILSALTGGTTTSQASVTGQVADPYKDEMLKNASHIPSIDQNLSDLLTEVRRVIKPRGSARSSSHVLVTDM